MRLLVPVTLAFLLAVAGCFGPSSDPAEGDAAPTPPEPHEPDEASGDTVADTGSVPLDGEQGTVPFSVRAPYKWEAWLNESAVIAGRDRWHRLDGLASEYRLKLREARREDPGSSRTAAIERDLSHLGHLRAFALPLVIKNTFPEFLAAHPFIATYLAGLGFVGALIGSVARPLGGWLSDRLGGARVTLAVFLGEAVFTLTAIMGVNQHSFPIFFGSFMAIFLLAGMGNGSTYRMIPAIFRHEVDTVDPVAVRNARRQAAAHHNVRIRAFGLLQQAWDHLRRVLQVGIHHAHPGRLRHLEAFHHGPAQAVPALLLHPMDQGDVQREPILQLADHFRRVVAAVVHKHYLRGRAFQCLVDPHQQWFHVPRFVPRRNHQ